MAEIFKPNEWFRRNFSTMIPNVIEPPPLMRLQTNSYEEFLQMNVPPAKRADSGLQAVFKSVFPSSTSTRPSPWSSSATPWSGPNTPSRSAASGGSPTRPRSRWWSGWSSTT